MWCACNYESVCNLVYLNVPVQHVYGSMLYLFSRMYVRVSTLLCMCLCERGMRVVW